MAPPEATPSAPGSGGHDERASPRNESPPTPPSAPGHGHDHGHAQDHAHAPAHDHAHGHGHGHGHGHDHPHGHGHRPGHHHGHLLLGRRLAFALGATVAFVLGEGAVGWWSGSLALLSDAGHNLADALALGLTWYAHLLAARRADARRTFGYHRVGVLAALLNALVLIAIAVAILVDAGRRVRHPQAIPGLPVVVTALVALVVNLVLARVLHAGHHDLNVRAARLHLFADAASSAGVLVAGICIALTGSSLPDPIASIGISVLIVASSWSILRESVGILLEAAPPGVDMEAVLAAIRAVPGVLGVHDLHAWTIGSGIIACSCHILVAEGSSSTNQQVQQRVAAALQELGITHTTIQVEVDACHPAADAFCVQDLPAPGTPRPSP